MTTTVAGLSGEYTVTHDEGFPAADLVRALEMDGSIPYRSIPSEGVAISCGQRQVEVGGETWTVVILGRHLTVA